MAVRGVSLFVAAVAAVAACAALPHPARAGTIVGKLDLPPRPARPPVEAKGFLDRIENPYKPAADVAVAPYLLVVLDTDAKSNASPQVTWELAGESFLRPVIGAPANAEIVLKNTSKTARSLAATEDPKLIPVGPINPTASRSFRVTEPGKIYNVRDSEAAHVHGTLVVVSTPFISNVDDANGFKFTDVPEGTYKLRVFYKDAWLDVDQPVTVPAKAKGDVSVNLKVPAFAPAAKK